MRHQSVTEGAGRRPRGALGDVVRQHPLCAKGVGAADYNSQVRLARSPAAIRQPPARPRLWRCLRAAP